MPAQTWTIKQRLILAAAPLAAAWLLRLLSATWRIKERHFDGKTPATKGDRRLLYAFWHGQILSVVGHYKGSNIQSMASRSFDGEIIARALVRLGYPAPARGSSSRGGRAALKELAGAVRQGRDVVLTPDGPRGPRHRAQPGVLSLARITQTPLVPVAFRCAPVLRLKGWDKLEIPLPFARGEVVFGKVMEAPPKGDLAVFARKLEKTMGLLNEEADARLDGRWGSA